jgi:hypothetical protein
MPVLEPDPPVAAAAALDWLTLAEAKAALNLSGATTHDAEIAPWVTATSLLLDHKVGPAVRRTITDETHDGGQGTIWARLYPVTSYTTIIEYAGLTATALTVENNLAQPAAAYRAEPYAPDPTLFSGRLDRRASGGDTYYPAGAANIIITYVAGRYADTASVDERFKAAARLTLQNLWNSQRPNLALVGEFEVPQSNWPRFAVPNAVREMLADEWHGGTVA